MQPKQVYVYTDDEEREDERERRGGWVVSNDLDPGNQVSSKLEPTPLAHIPADLYCCSFTTFHDDPTYDPAESQ